MIDHAGTIAEQALTLLARALVPFGAPPRGLVLGAAALVVLAALIVRARLPHDHAARRPLTLWLWTVLGGLVGVAASYALIVPADDHYLPLAPGVVNRINLLAAAPYGLLAVAFAMLIATLALAAWPSALRSAPIVGAALSLVIAGGYLNRTIEDRHKWDDAARLQERVLSAIQASLPHDGRSSAPSTPSARPPTAPTASRCSRSRGTSRARSACACTT